MRSLVAEGSHRRVLWWPRGVIDALSGGQGSHRRALWWPRGVIDAPSGGRGESSTRPLVAEGSHRRGHEANPRPWDNRSVDDHN
ncbi:hypothetical protein NHX12_030384 [Muraenolepis orangiensis]|uniref:Uncharacterized protein n=1 Tax=Muraenolepis orangiensis TaxID=630683 RepID=A0A9Q0ILN8_9TELE|nr:hypothetical protein NHX12_030384 [Muraenolepis orangiensis]